MSNTLPALSTLLSWQLTTMLLQQLLLLKLRLLNWLLSHCLLPLSWLSEEDSDQAKHIHLRVANGAQVRALLFNNIIYARSVARLLVSISQLKAMLDLRFVWGDGSPILLFCSSGLKHILLQARVVHHVPLITTEELAVLCGTK